jgi:hypothetical protein
LEAAAALELKELDEAEAASLRVIEHQSDKVSILPEVASRAHAVLGEVYRRSDRLPQARDAFSKALRIDEDSAVAVAGLAATLEELAEDGEPLSMELALAAYQQLDEIALTDWQNVVAAKGLFRLSLKQGDFAQADAQLERLCRMEQGLDLTALRQLAEKHDAETTLAKLAVIESQMRSDTAPLKEQPASRLPLLNGDFELGIGSYWAPWSTENCLAEARVDRLSRSGAGGVACLRIEHRSLASPQSHGTLSQSLPATSGQRYRVSLWCKGEAVTPGGFTVAIDGQYDEPVITLREGTFDWRQVSGEFELPSAADEGELQNVRLQIVSTAPGKVWLDDIQIERMGREGTAQ